MGWKKITSMISRTISIEDLLSIYPETVGFLINKNIPCLVCGEPLWGTLEEVARDNGLNDPEIDMLVDELNRLAGRVQV